MSPLANPRHEAFAFALAFGSTPAEAYLKAGFNPKNRKARAQPLADDPLIVNRVEQLLQEDPALEACFARHRNAQPFTIIPQSADELAQFVWQIIKGTRQVTAIQWQAIRFLGRLKRWDRSGRHERGPDSGLSAVNCESLAILDAVQIARDTQLHRATVAKNNSDDDADDSTSDLDQSEFEPVALFDPDAPIYPHDPDYVPSEEALAEHAAQLAAAALLNSPDISDPEAETAASPPKIHICGSNVDSNPHAQLPDNQTINPENPQSNGVRKTAAGSPEGTAGTPDQMWTNVDSNPHAQLAENQPLKAENPQMWIKKEKSTSRPRCPKTAPSEELLPPQASAARTSSLASKALATEAAAKNPTTPDPLPAPIPPKATLPPNAADLIPRGFQREDVEWLATVQGPKAPAWVRRAFPAAESAPRPHPAPPPPRAHKEYRPHELEWLAHVMGKDTPAWVRTALRALTE